MGMPNTYGNFNGTRPVIDANDACMLLIDHQSGLFQTVKDMEMTTLRRHAAALAKMATLAKLPVITTASVPQGPFLQSVRSMMALKFLQWWMLQEHIQRWPRRLLSHA